jgi:hypothetical protein
MLKDLRRTQIIVENDSDSFSTAVNPFLTAWIGIVTSFSFWTKTGASMTAHEYSARNSTVFSKPHILASEKAQESQAFPKIDCQGEGMDLYKLICFYF